MHPTTEIVDHALATVAADLLTSADAARLTPCGSRPGKRYLTRHGTADTVGWVLVSTLKDRLTRDMREAMKARAETTTAALRMALAEVRNAEVAGKSARNLSDDDVLAVLAKEAKKRREAAEAYEQGGRAELAAKERAEEEVLARYLPAQLTDAELTELVARVLADGGFTGTPAMGPAMKAVQAQVAGRAEGARVAAEVRRQLRS